MNSKQAQERSESQILLFRRVSRGWSAASLGREQGCVGGGYATGMHTTRQNLKGSTNPPQSPPLSVLWIYAIFQMDLGPAVVSLILVGMWFLWSGLKFFP